MEKNKDNQRRKEYYELNRDTLLERKKKYYKQHRESITENKKEYNKNRRHTNLIYRLILNNSTRIRDALKSNNKATSSIDLLGCSKELFFNWIKWQLPYEMSDDEFNKLFHIDHVRPIATFNLSDPESQYDAFHWTNAQPMLISKNLSKGAKRDLWSEVMQELKVRIFLKLYYPDEC